VIGAVKKYFDGTINDVECNLELKAYMTGTSVDSARNGSEDLDALIRGYIEENPGIIDEIKKNEKSTNRIIGHVMKQTGGAYSSADIVAATKSIVSSKL
jgi:aspartyl-tRNA(Asn)/glutamyl-tRNA(Gln) amidotransferase subunit B